VHHLGVRQCVAGPAFLVDGEVIATFAIAGMPEQSATLAGGDAPTTPPASKGPS
jgi:hypothetical protein